MYADEDWSIGEAVTKREEVVTLDHRWIKAYNDMDERYNYNYTVIIPHYTPDGNVEMLKRAVESIPDRKDIQVIIVDNSINHIDQNLFAGRANVEIIYSPNERKAGGARNEGIRISKGKWILFLDADDFFSANSFELTDKYISSNYDIVFFMPEGVYSDDIEKKSDRADPYKSIVRSYLDGNGGEGLRKYFTVPWSKMIKADLIKNNCIYFDEVPASNDVMFSLITGLKAEKITADPGIIYIATVNRGSLTRTVSLENIESRFYVAQRRNKLLKKYGMKKDYSVMNHILQAAKYGPKPFFRLLTAAAREGNVFVGSGNWAGTFIKKIRSKKEKEDNKKYTITKQ